MFGPRARRPLTRITSRGDRRSHLRSLFSGRCRGWRDLDSLRSRGGPCLAFHDLFLSKKPHPRLLHFGKGEGKHDFNLAGTGDDVVGEARSNYLKKRIRRARGTMSIKSKIERLHGGFRARKWFGPIRRPDLFRYSYVLRIFNNL